MGISNKIKHIMKTFAIAALLANASAQITFCTSPADCPEDLLNAGGCCSTQTTTAVPEDAEWGFIASNVYQKTPEVGDSVSICMNAAMVEARAATGGSSDNVTDL